MAIKLAAFGDYALWHLLRHTGLDFCSWAGGAIARATAPRNHANWDRRARANLAALEPGLSQAERDRRITAMWDNIGRCHTEFFVLDKLVPKARVEIDGMAHVEAIRASRRPLLVVCLHLGNWELMGAVLLEAGFKVNSIIEPPKNNTRAAIANTMRERCGATLFPPSRAGGLMAMRGLMRGETQLIYIDELSGGRVHAPAFSRPLVDKGNIGNVPRLAARSGAAVVFGHCLRLNGCRFKVVFSEELAFKTNASDKRAHRDDLALLDARAEALIRPNLDQWLMLHDFRFDR